MQKFTLLFMAVLFCCSAFAQDNAITKHYTEQERDASYTQLNVTKKTFKLFEEIEATTADEKSVLGAISKLNGIKVLFKEVSEEGPELFKKAERKIAADVNYEELMSVQDASTNVLFMIREEKDVVKELFLIAGGPQEFLLASLYGEIDLKSMSHLATVISKNGKEWFEIFENIDSDELVFGSAAADPSGNSGTLLESDLNLKVFPNPADDFVQIETIDGKDGFFQMAFFSGIGEQVAPAKEISLPFQLNLDDLPSGAYFLRLTDSNGHFKNIPIVKK